MEFNDREDAPEVWKMLQLELFDKKTWNLFSKKKVEGWDVLFKNLQKEDGGIL